MKRIAIQFIFSIFMMNASWGIALGLDLPDAIKRADIIAHIRVDDDLEIIPGIKHSRGAGGRIIISTNPDDRRKYRKIATASIIHNFKGYEGNQPIKIRHTNGFICPNVVYRKGGEYIVFLRKEPDSDYYVTMNSYAGQFKIEDSQVVAFYLMDGYRHPDDLRLPYERVVTFLRETIQKQNG